MPQKFDKTVVLLENNRKLKKDAKKTTARYPFVVAALSSPISLTEF